MSKFYYVSRVRSAVDGWYDEVWTCDGKHRECCTPGRESETFQFNLRRLGYVAFAY